MVPNQPGLVVEFYDSTFTLKITTSFTPGTYYVKVYSSNSAVVTGAYRYLFSEIIAELLSLYFYVMGACVNDGYEPNDASFTNLNGESGTIFAVLCKGDVDLYTVTVSVTGVLAVRFEITFQVNINFVYQVLNPYTGESFSGDLTASSVDITINCTPGTYYVACGELRPSGRATYSITWSAFVPLTSGLITTGEITTGITSGELTSGLVTTAPVTSGLITSGVVTSGPVTSQSGKIFFD